jgi:O-antigen/teichoic acid export membrane protein
LLIVGGIAAAGYGLLAIIAPTLFPILLGSQWDSAGPLASLLCLPIGLQFLVTPFYAILWHSGLAAIKLKVDAVFTLAAIAVLLWPWWGSPETAILVWVAVATIHRLAELALICRSIATLRRTAV